MQLHIATMNIYKNEENFLERISLIIDYFKTKRFDIIALQEDYKDSMQHSGEHIKEALEMQMSSFETRKKERAGEFSSANLTILSNFDICSEELIELPEDRDDGERALQKIEIKIDADKISLYNTHLTHLKEEIRLLEVQKIVDTIKNDSNAKHLLCGDFNATPQSKVVELLLKNLKSINQIEDTHRNGSILDYIFYSESINVVSYEIYRDFALSDHFCLSAKVEI